MPLSVTAPGRPVTAGAARPVDHRAMTAVVAARRDHARHDPCSTASSRAAWGAAAVADGSGQTRPRVVGDEGTRFGHP